MIKINGHTEEDLMKAPSLSRYSFGAVLDLTRKRKILFDGKFCGLYIFDRQDEQDNNVILDEEPKKRPDYQDVAIMFNADSRHKRNSFTLKESHFGNHGMEFKVSGDVVFEKNEHLMFLNSTLVEIDNSTFANNGYTWFVTRKDDETETPFITNLLFKENSNVSFSFDIKGDEEPPFIGFINIVGNKSAYEIDSAAIMLSTKSLDDRDDELLIFNGNKFVPLRMGEAYFLDLYNSNYINCSFDGEKKSMTTRVNSAKEVTFSNCTFNSEKVDIEPIDSDLMITNSIFIGKENKIKTNKDVIDSSEFRNVESGVIDCAGAFSNNVVVGKVELADVACCEGSYIENSKIVGAGEIKNAYIKEKHLYDVGDLSNNVSDPHKEVSKDNLEIDPL